MEKAIRVGIVGAGFAARIHYEGLRRVHGVPVEVVGVTSKTPEARDAFARQNGVRPFGTLEELCEAVDVVDLCSHPRRMYLWRLRRWNAVGTLSLRSLSRGFTAHPPRTFRETLSPSNKCWMKPWPVATACSARPGSRANGFVMLKTGCMPPPSRRSGKCWRRAAGNCFG